MVATQAEWKGQVELTAAGQIVVGLVEIEENYARLAPVQPVLTMNAVVLVDAWIVVEIPHSVTGMAAVHSDRQSNLVS